MLYALLFLPALAGIAYVLLRPRRVTIVEETALAPMNPFDTIDAILEQMEAALEAAAAQLEHAA
jgi:hypothetical protein